MKTADATRISNNAQTFEHKIEVGRYDEEIYFIDTPATSSQLVQEKIDGLLVRNQGVGIIIGCFDEKLSIRMISGFATRLLGYKNTDEILQGTKEGLLSMVVSNDDMIRDILLRSSNEVFGCTFRMKDGTAIPVRINHDTGTAPNGEKLWYISVRRLGEMQYDPLTGAYTRRGFSEHIQNMKANGEDLKEYAILYINLKGFKALNDLYGSTFGDGLLMEVYDYFYCSELKPVACARKDSDKYLLLVKKVNICLDHLQELLKVPYSYKGSQEYADSVCGIYYIEDAETDVNKMIECAVLAETKIDNMFVSPYAVFESEMFSDYLSRIRALSFFNSALENNEFQVYYQPVMDCKTGRIVSAEALIRWETNDGIIPPGSFLPALENNGCIVKLDEYVLTKVIRFLRSRAASQIPVVPISVNLSRMDFFDKERTNRLFEIFKQDEIVRKYVHFEITETSHLFVKEKQLEFIHNIDALGGMVYIDDFGVANSSLDMLSLFDFRVLKLDMQFIREIEKNSKICTLIEATIFAAHKLNMKVVAEGVETEEQLKLLQSMTCDYIQGYYYSKPLPQKVFEEYLIAHI